MFECMKVRVFEGYVLFYVFLETNIWVFNFRYNAMQLRTTLFYTQVR